MTIDANTRLLSPEEIAVCSGQQTPFLRLPERTTVFATREMRLRQLAGNGHGMADFLRFVAELARAQQSQLLAMPMSTLALPTATELADAAAAGLAPLPADTGVLDPAWHGVLGDLLARLRLHLAPGPALTTADALAKADPDHLDRQAERCLGTKGIEYQSLEARDASAAGGKARPSAVQAETCTACGHYLKIVHMERGAEVDPVADDLASLTLDLLVSDAGLLRHGVNLMLLFGDPEPDTASEPAGRPPDPGGP